MAIRPEALWLLVGAALLWAGVHIAGRLSHKRGHHLFELKYWADIQKRARTDTHAWMHKHLWNRVLFTACSGIVGAVIALFTGGPFMLMPILCGIGAALAGWMLVTLVKWAQHYNAAPAKLQAETESTAIDREQKLMADAQRSQQEAAEHQQTIRETAAQRELQLQQRAANRERELTESIAARDAQITELQATISELRSTEPRLAVKATWKLCQPWPTWLSGNTVHHQIAALAQSPETARDLYALVLRVTNVPHTSGKAPVAEEVHATIIYKDECRALPLQIEGQWLSEEPTPNFWGPFSGAPVRIVGGRSRDMIIGVQREEDRYADTFIAVDEESQRFPDWVRGDTGMQLTGREVRVDIQLWTQSGPKWRRLLLTARSDGHFDLARDMVEGDEEFVVINPWTRTEHEGTD